MVPPAGVEGVDGAVMWPPAGRLPKRPSVRRAMRGSRRGRRSSPEVAGRPGIRSPGGRSRVMTAVLAAAAQLAAAPGAQVGLEVGTSDHLLFDTFWESTRSNLELVVHPPVKSGLILTPEYPWEPLIYAFNNLIKVNDSDYRIYYDVIGAAPRSVDPSGQNGYRFLCVATSKDGLTGWTKPLLPHVPFHDGLTNTTHNLTNIVGGAKHLGGSNIVYDARSQRFIGFADGFAYVSDDGFLFTIGNCRPARTGCVCGSKGNESAVASCQHLNFSSPNGVVYDPETQQYNVFFRTYKPRPDKHFCPGGDPTQGGSTQPDHLRAIGMLTVSDLLAPDWGPGDHSDFAQYLLRQIFLLGSS